MKHSSAVISYASELLIPFDASPLAFYKIMLFCVNNLVSNRFVNRQITRFNATRYTKQLE